MKYILLLLVLMATIAFGEQIYMKKDTSGSVVYSDTPIGNNSVVIPAPQANVAPAATPSSKPNMPVSNVPTTLPSYTVFTIVTPANQETIQNQPTISVNVRIAPPLRNGDSIQIFIDGTPWGQPMNSTQFQFTAPDRGTHELTAKLFDAQGNVLKISDTNTIYVHHAALGPQSG